MFRERGNAVRVEDAGQPSPPDSAPRLSRKQKRRASLKTVEQERTRPSSFVPAEPPAPSAPREEQPAAPDVPIET
ncbi:MAG TPA: hypothetical protein VF340_04920, partial [Methyloceanibacter sp.]